MTFCNTSLYGNYRTRTFADIWSSKTDFVTDLTAAALPLEMESRIEDLYYLLYGMYGNSHIAYSDENQFKYRVYGIIYQYGATWARKLDEQKTLRELSDEDIALGSKQVYNKAFNPAGITPTGIDDEIATINEQTVAKSKRGVLERKSIYLAMLNTDFTQEFLNRFKSLFMTVVQPELPLWYVTKITNDDILIEDEDDE